MAVHQFEMAGNIVMRGAEESAAQMEKFGGSMARSSQYIEQARKSMRLFAVSLVGTRIGMALTNIGRKMLDFAKQSMTMAFEWETAMRKVRTQTDLTDRGFRKLDAAALRIAGKLPFALDDVTQSLYDLYSGTNLQGMEAINVLELTGKAAVAGGAEISTATDAVIGAYNAFNLEATDLNDVLDLQFQLVRSAKGDYEDFANALNNAYPSAVRFGQSMETLFASISFASKGSSASPAQSIISVSRAMDQLGRAKNAANMEQFGVDVYNAAGEVRPMIDILTDFSAKLDGLSAKERSQVFYDIFGVGGIQAGRFLNSVLGPGGIERLTAEMDKFGTTAEGAMSRAFEIMLDKNPQLAIEILTNRFSTMRIELARRLFPTINKFVDFLQGLLDRFDRLSPGMQDVIAKTIVLGGVFLIVTGRMFQFIAAMAGAQSMLILTGMTWTSVIGAMLKSLAVLAVRIAVFVAIGAAVVWVVRHLDDLKRAWLEMEGPMSLVIQLVSTLALVALAVWLKGAIIAVGRQLMWFVAILIGRLAGALAAGAAGMAGFAASAVAAAAPLIALTAAIYLVVLAVRAWMFANEEHAKSVEATNNLTQAYVDQVKLGTRTFEEGVARVKQAWNDESLTYEERRQAVHDGLKALNDWRRAGGKVVDANDATVRSVEKQIKVNEKLGQGTDRLTTKVRTFAGMTMEELAKWQEEVSNNIDLVGTAFSNLGDDAKLTTDKVLNQLQRQIDAARRFFKNVRLLAEMGISEEALRRLIEMGPQGQLIADKFAKGTEEGVQRLDKLLVTAEGLTASYGDKSIDIYERVAAATERNGKKQEDAHRRVAESITAIPEFHHTKVTADVSQAVNTVAGWIRKLAGTVVKVTVGADIPGYGSGTGTMFHSGGPVPGGGDLPAILQGGEYVIRRDRTREYAPLLEALNRGDRDDIRRMMGAFAEKFHNGGMVGRPRVNFDMGSVVEAARKVAANPFAGGGGLVAIGRILQRMGFSVGEHPMFGGVAPVHTAGSYHYMGRAIDVNWPGANEPAMLDRIYPMLARLPHAELLWRSKDHFDHLHYAMKNGGVIREPVMGVGMRTGASYSFAEDGPETVSPGEGGSSFTYAPTFNNANVDAKQAVVELDWFRRTSPWSS